MVAMFENFVNVTQEEDVPQVDAELEEVSPNVSWLSSKLNGGVCLCRQVRSDWFVYVVLSCLPWVGKELYEKKDVEVDRLLSQIEAYLK